MAQERLRQQLAEGGHCLPTPLGSSSKRPIPPLPRPLLTLAPPRLQYSPVDLVSTDPIPGPSSQRLDTPPTLIPQECIAQPLPPLPPVAPTSSSDNGPFLSTIPHITCRGWSVSQLCESSSNFRPVRRMSAMAPEAELRQELENYESSGEPLIIEDWDKHPRWNGDLLSMRWLLENSGRKQIHVRNVHDHKDYRMTLSEFVDQSRAQEPFSVAGESQRLYWKDADCPNGWREWLLEALPPQLLPNCPNDLLRHLHSHEAVESLLCYLGIGDTYTPAHKDLCASSGHNLMCFSENNGSSFWFMTKSSAAPKAAEYFQKTIGQELDWETYVTTITELQNAPFTVYVAEQKVGDLVLVPPRSVHQVVNQGGLSMKTSWSRMTLDNLKTALQCELPIYRRVCRPEQYRVKTILYRTMLHHTEALLASLTQSKSNAAAVGGGSLTAAGLVEYGSSADSGSDSATPPPTPGPNSKEHAKILRTVLHLFDDVLREEYALPRSCSEYVLKSDTAGAGWSVALNFSTRRLRMIPPQETDASTDKSRASSCNFACDFCGADIFQSFFECRKCRTSGDDTPLQVGDGLLVCPTCYVEGRSCECEEMTPVQCRPFEYLLQDRNRAAHALRQSLPGDTSDRPIYKDLKERGGKGIHDGLCVFQAACALRDFRRKNSEKAPLVRRCRAALEARRGHEVPALTALGCTTCHSAKCFPHILAGGTHVAAAISAHMTKEAGVWHKLHKAKGEAIRENPLRLYDVRGSDLENRLLIAASSFRKCRPGHPNLKLGFYDVEVQLESEQLSSVPSSNPSPNLSAFRQLPPLDFSNLPSQSQGDRKSESPLTPLFDHSDEDNLPSVSPTDTVVDVHDAAEVRSVILIDDESDQDKQPSLPPEKLKPPKHMAYVQIPTRIPKRLKRPSSSTPPEYEPQKKKARSLILDFDEDELPSQRMVRASWSASAVGRTSVRGTPPSRSSSEDRVGEDYGTDLARAISNAQGTAAPIFTEDSTVPNSLHGRAIRRVITPDVEDPASSPPGNPSHSPREPNASMHPSPVHRVARELPRTRGNPSRPTSPSTHSQQMSLSASLSSQSAFSPSNADIPSPKIPRLQKRKAGPPGIHPTRLDEHKQRWRQEEQHARKKARPADPEFDGDMDVIEVDAEEIQMPASADHSDMPARGAAAASTLSQAVPAPPQAPPPEERPSAVHGPSLSVSRQGTPESDRPLVPVPHPPASPESAHSVPVPSSVSQTELRVPDPSSASQGPISGVNISTGSPQSDALLFRFANLPHNRSIPWPTFLRAMADAMEPERADIAQPSSVIEELAKAVANVKEQVTEIRAGCQCRELKEILLNVQAQNEASERDRMAMAVEVKQLQDTLTKERGERHHIAVSLREVHEKTAQHEKDLMTHAKVEEVCHSYVSKKMPTLRSSVHEMMEKLIEAKMKETVEIKMKEILEPTMKEMVGALVEEHLMSTVQSTQRQAPAPSAAGSSSFQVEDEKQLPPGELGTSERDAQSNKKVYKTYGGHSREKRFHSSSRHHTTHDDRHHHSHHGDDRRSRGDSHLDRHRSHNGANQHMRTYSSSDRSRNILGSGGTDETRNRGGRSRSRYDDDHSTPRQDRHRGREESSQRDRRSYREDSSLRGRSRDRRTDSPTRSRSPGARSERPSARSVQGPSTTRRSSDADLDRTSLMGQLEDREVEESLAFSSSPVESFPPHRSPNRHRPHLLESSSTEKGIPNKSSVTSTEDSLRAGSQVREQGSQLYVPPRRTVSRHRSHYIRQ